MGLTSLKEKERLEFCLSLTLSLVYEDTARKQQSANLEDRLHQEPNLTAP